MTQELNLCVLIPVYNHESKLTSLVEKISSSGLPILLVDDGSSGSCASLLKQLSAQFPQVFLEVHSQNKGKGGAIKTGLKLAARQGFTHALQVDADGQHNLSDIPRFTDLMQGFPDALIAGCPEFDDSMPRHRYYARYLTHVWVWINCLSTQIVDSMCGFRVYPVQASNTLIDSSSIGDRMDFDTEFMVRWFWSGDPIRQIQTRVIYPEEGVSHFRLWLDNVLISRMHARLFFGMLLRFPKLLARRWTATRG